jgi:hypothetical protein
MRKYVREKRTNAKRVRDFRRTIPRSPDESVAGSRERTYVLGGLLLRAIPQFIYIGNECQRGEQTG